ncbi:phosphatase [Rhizocola hellebori]|uniref:Phosphatase n=1 Tax=Rhizocola hellebori TaxID=1392758 RepID=A0A8J3QDF4_9ACTN|nr:HAD hydrolase-like protein [Rhizocola hellebori]GIH08714.1 phosphatase [Rhizocola hellebori]
MHLVWDWNGTLLNDIEIVVASTNAAFLKAGGQAITTDDHRRRFRRPIIEFYSESIGRELLETEFLELDEIFHRSYLDALPTVTLTPDATKAMGAWMGTQSLLSMWFHHELVPTVNRFGLDFLRVDGLRDPLNGTYKADHLRTHLGELGLAGGDVVLIGDSVDDADAALAVGARCVLYSGGFTHEENLLACGVPVARTLVEAVALAA